MRIRISMLLVAIVLATFAGIPQALPAEAQSTPMIGDTRVSVDLSLPADLKVDNGSVRFAPGQTPAEPRSAGAYYSCTPWYYSGGGMERWCSCKGSGCAYALKYEWRNFRFGW